MLHKSVVMFIRESHRTVAVIGSGTLVFHHGKLLAISAAHVIEDLVSEKGTYYLYAAGKALRLGGCRYILSDKIPFENDRWKDPLDLGVWVLRDEVVDAMNGEVTFIERDFIETKQTEPHVLFYQAVGFPSSKNTKLLQSALRISKPFIPEALIYGGQNWAEKVFPHPLYDESMHVAVNYDQKNNFNDDGMSVNPPPPPGMSGGLVQGCFDYLPNTGGLYPTCASAVLLAHSIQKKALIGLRFHVVFEWLDNHASAIERAAKWKKPI